MPFVKTLKSACAKHEFALVEINQTLNNLLRKLSKIKVGSRELPSLCLNSAAWSFVRSPFLHGSLLFHMQIESPQEHVVEKTDTISYKLETIASKVGRILAVRCARFRAHTHHHVSVYRNVGGYISGCECCSVKVGKGRDCYC